MSFFLQPNVSNNDLFYKKSKVKLYFSLHAGYCSVKGTSDVTHRDKTGNWVCRNGIILWI